MKLTILAAAAVALAGMAPGLVAPAAAQHTVVTRHSVVHRDGPERSHPRKVCRTEYRHHHRVRTCRTVRG